MIKKTFLIGTLLALAACVAAPISSSTTAPALPTTAVTTSGFSGDLNALRAGGGLGPVVRDVALTRAAQAHAADMVQRDYFSHVSAGGPNGRTFTQRAKAAGCNLRNGAENIAAGQGSEGEVFTAWRNSAGHRRNMLGASYTRYGLGRAGDTWVLLLSSGC